MYAKELAAARYRDWSFYRPYLELVPCAGERKPALFIRVGSHEFGEFSRTVEPRETSWRWYQIRGTTPYVLFELAVTFDNTNGAPIGLGGPGRLVVTTHAATEHSSRLRCACLFDPADAGARAAVKAWAEAPSPTVMFFVEENLEGISYVSVDHTPADKQGALEQIEEARQQLRDNPVNVPGAFARACEFARDALPAVSWWY